MKLDPKDARLAKLLAPLQRLSALHRRTRPKEERDWAGETARTFKAGKLEDFDLVEFVVAAAGENGGPEGMLPAQAEALLGLIRLAALRDARLSALRPALERRAKSP